MNYKLFELEELEILVKLEELVELGELVERLERARLDFYAVTPYRFCIETSCECNTPNETDSISYSNCNGARIALATSRDTRYCRRIFTRDYSQEGLHGRGFTAEDSRQRIHRRALTMQHKLTINRSCQ